MVSDFHLKRSTTVNKGVYGEVAFAARGAAASSGCRCCRCDTPFAIKASPFCGERKGIADSIKAGVHVKLPGVYGTDHQQRIYREAVLLRYFSLAPHPNLVRLLDLRCHLREPARSEGGVCLVMENAGTSVHTLMRANPGTAAAERPTMGSVLREIPESGLVLPLGEVRDLCWQLLQGLRYIHEAGFMHRDIKSVNVLLRELAGCGGGGGGAAAGGPPPPPRKWQLKLADFGMSRSTKKEGPAASADAPLAHATSLTANILTPTFKPLEIVDGDGRVNYDGHKVDVFSAALVIAELFMLLGPDSPDRARLRHGLLNPMRVLPERPESPWAASVQIECILRVMGRPSDLELSWLKEESDQRKGHLSLYERVVDTVQRLWGGGGGGGGGGAHAPRLAEFLPHAPAEGLDLLRFMMRIRPSDRASVQQALAHPFFRELREGPHGRAYEAEEAFTGRAAGRVGEPKELHADEFAGELEEGFLKQKMREETDWWKKHHTY